MTKIFAEPLVGEVYMLYLSTVLGLKTHQNENDIMGLVLINKLLFFQPLLAFIFLKVLYMLFMSILAPTDGQRKQPEKNPR